MTKLSDDDIAGLLPFYVAGTLSDDDERDVAHWLETDPRGLRALERALEEQSEVITANEKIAVPSGALARLMQDVAREPAAATFNVSRPGLLTRVSDWLTAAPPGLAWTAAAALALVVIAQNVPAVLQGLETPYEVSSGTNTTEGSTYLVRFAENADMAAVGAALKEAHAVITDGPKGNGNYVVRLLEDDGIAEAGKRIEALRAKRDIVKLVIEKSPGIQ